MKKRNIIIAAIAGTVITGVAYAIKKVNDSKLKREAAIDHSKEQMVNPDDVPFTNASAFIDNAPCVWLYVALEHADEIRSYDDQLIYLECSDEGILTVDSYNNKILIEYDEEFDFLTFHYVGGI